MSETAGWQKVAKQIAHDEQDHATCPATTSLQWSRRTKSVFVDQLLLMSVFRVCLYINTCVCIYISIHKYVDGYSSLNIFFTQTELFTPFTTGSGCSLWVLAATDIFLLLSLKLFIVQGRSFPSAVRELLNSPWLILYAFVKQTGWCYSCWCWIVAIPELRALFSVVCCFLST